VVYDGSGGGHGQGALVAQFIGDAGAVVAGGSCWRRWWPGVLDGRWEGWGLEASEVESVVGSDVVTDEAGGMGSHA
jgi:hypothetical protein